MVDVSVVGKIGKDELIEIQRRKKPKDPYVPYIRIGKEFIRTNKGKGETVEHVMENLSKGGYWLFFRLSRIRDEKTNIVVMTPKDATEAQKISRAYKELASHGLVYRLRREHYLLNPDIFLPAPGEYYNVLTEWDMQTQFTSNQ